MKYKYLKLFLFAGLVSLMATSCRKDSTITLEDQGSTFIKFMDGPQKKLFFSPFSEVRTIDLFSLRKDAPSEGEANSSTPVTVSLAPGLIDRYNDENGTHFEVLPDSLYAIEPTIARSGDNYDFTLQAGQFAKEFTIKLDGSKWNLEHTYALGFGLSAVGGNKITSGRDSILVLLSVKNKWDGVYSVTGSYTDAGNAAFTGLYPYEWELQTTSPTQCVVVDNVLLGGVGFVFSTTGNPSDLSYYGNFGLLINFDPETDKIVSVTNYYGQPAPNTRTAELDPTGENQYADGEIKIRYFMKQPSFIPDPPHIRCRFNEVWKYERPRE
ncbi:DUF1735 domain-containing protein [Foetidibacter luteolus]|uniref:DUF1735 domain-containing protein n=1 Tax=Foetidibacter luteolus TaxID=2608880 RepID=UPI001A995E53|nr:DUF1735 domain-containing protein [Foetidibacter luteolus]